MNPIESLKLDESVPLRRLSTSSSSTIDLTDDERLLNSSTAHLGQVDKSSGLPPMDCGWHAWSFLFGVWLIESLCWGFALTFGIFQSYYSQHPLFANHKSIPTIGALTTGVSYLLCPFINPITLRFPQYHRHQLWFGWSLCILGLVCASFATQVWHLILFQGILYGLGWVICYIPFLIMINEWFDKRRGLAYGIIFGASGISGLILPFALETLLHKYGFRSTLRMFAVSVVVVSSPAWFLIKPRRSPKSTLQAGPYETEKSSNHWRFLRNPYFYPFVFAVLLQGFAFFLPNIFLPSYAMEMGLSASSADILLSITALAQVPGQIFNGHFSDKTNEHLPSFVSCLVSGFAALLLWGPAKDFMVLAVFSLVWGAFAASYSVLWTQISKKLSSGPEEAMTIYAVLSFERGIANVLAGPISAILITEEVNIKEYGLAKYKSIVLFTAISLLLGSLAGVTWIFDRRRKAKHHTRTLGSF
ncbi:MFS general substrate transporter [Patellaria atrata CBS 101060]|uniref:MFS general substrate transporter n=1 Tax=Patellaria atrata CBS 101060 TaxID=1346257 RepID=A0A9P4SAT0_9PEZI|nr:MFS general substrate transporter [Patellaria atrata CBS 101060]